MYTFERAIVSSVLNSLKLPKKLIHILVGPRQVGKTTASMQIAKKWEGPIITISADTPLPPDHTWLISHWNNALLKPGCLLIIDEIQKVNGWNETIKMLWDKTQLDNSDLNVILLGSSALLLQKGFAESLSGRFLLHRCLHWSYNEMKCAFGATIDEWFYYGGYPGAFVLRDHPQVWSQYIRDSLIETVLARDILQMQTVTKPSLLRHLFMLAASYPSQILSYNKMLGQLQDAGNTTTLANYVKLLESAFLVSGLEQYKKDVHGKRGSSPKLIMWNNALVNALYSTSLSQLREDYTKWGRIVENAIGSIMLNRFQGTPFELYYWRQRDNEVDFIVKNSSSLYAIEIQAGKFECPKGMQNFLKLYPEAKPVFVGTGGIPFEEFLDGDLIRFFN